MKNQTPMGDPCDASRLPRALRLIQDAAESAANAADILVMRGADASGLEALARALRDYHDRVQRWPR